MANMSYCRFQNTELDLRDCVNTLEEAYDLDDLDLSDAEASAMNAMRNMCQEFLDAYAQLESMSMEAAE